MSKMIKYYNNQLIEYEILSLVDYYDDILKTPTIPWDFNTRKIDEAYYVAFSLTETMEKLKGLGLSANQVGLKDRVCVINAGQQAWVMFNPIITWKSSTPATYSEGCLSYPGLYLKVPRSNQVKVQFQAIGGEVVQQEVEGLTAVCIQHELDHLNGIRYTDLVSPIKLEQAKKKVKTTLKKMSRVTAEDLKRLGLSQ